MLQWNQNVTEKASFKVSLPPLIPPFRFNQVEGTSRSDALYRSAFPTQKNFRFLKRLRLKTIVSLIPRDLFQHQDLITFCKEEKITHECFAVCGNQEPLAKDENDFNAPAPSHHLCANILTMCIDPDNLPLLLHCTNGAHVTGLIVCLLRRLQNYQYEEYTRFTKNHFMEEEEHDFVNKFFVEISLPNQLPNWLWGGERLSRHPTLPLFGAAVSVGISNEDFPNAEFVNNEDQQQLQQQQLDVKNSSNAPLPSSFSVASSGETTKKRVSTLEKKKLGKNFLSFVVNELEEDNVEEDDYDDVRGMCLEVPGSVFKQGLSEMS